MRRRKWMAGLLAATLLLLTVACSGNNTAPTTAEQTTTAPVTTAEPVTTPEAVAETTTVTATTAAETTPAPTMSAAVTTESETTAATTEAETAATLETTTEPAATEVPTTTGVPVNLGTVTFTPSAGELVDTGSIRAICPNGWNYIPHRDYFSEDENAINKNNLYLMKEGTDSMDPYPFVTIMFFGKNNNFFMPLEEEKNFYNNVTDVSFTLGEDVWEGFSFIVAPGTEEAVLRKKSTNAFTVGVRLKDTNGTVSLDDADVLTILSSIDY